MSYRTEPTMGANNDQQVTCFARGSTHPLHTRYRIPDPAPTHITRSKQAWSFIRAIPGKARLRKLVLLGLSTVVFAFQRIRLLHGDAATVDFRSV